MEFRALIVGATGAIIGVAATLLIVWPSKPDPSGATLKKLETDVTVLYAEVERLKKVVPDQAHAMADVDYHFTNLWFAGKAENWPLADFYWKETLSHIRWAVRIIPVRKDGAGRDVDVQAILTGLENSLLMELGDSIKGKDHEKFEAKYKLFLEACYTCHKSAEKPYLRPQVPGQRATGIVNFDPGATWPN